MSKERLQRNIEKAQHEIDTKKDLVKNGSMRQKYHFMAQTGWINDPNGLIYFQGNYHFFFQYNPYHGFWDSMYWGHAVSRDLLHWEYLPPALAPSETYDDHPKGGCFSGSAIERDGRLYLMYTATTNAGEGFEQTQCLAYSEDGIHFEKYEGNPLVKAPAGIPADQFRDPKIWKHEDFYYMVVGACKEERGMALLYRSADLIHWEFWNVLFESRGEWGRMWECPDFYQLGDKYVLTFSPIASGDHTAVWLSGQFDYETGRFCPERSGEIDWGLDYYAPQSFLAPDGRRITVGWANGWEWMPQWKDWGPSFQEGWCGFFNVPREVRMLKDGSLQYLPVRELEALREKPCRIQELFVTEEERELIAGDGICFEMKFRIDLERTDAKSLELDLRCGKGKKTACVFDFEKGQLSVNRNNADGWSRGTSRSVLFLKGKQELDVHIFSDQSSIELFSDQYRNNHSNNVFAGNTQRMIKVHAYGGTAAIVDYESYGLQCCF
ncbi:MAG: glycoside hydrolase family 32 protein [Clostridiales bacterium]|nr:glycoside hydrolase family 32 protein [Clostridiales bacterium]